MSFIATLVDFFKLFQGTKERASPSDILKDDAFTVNGAIVTIDCAKTHIPFIHEPVVTMAAFADTNSMDGFFDIGHNCILIRGWDEENHKIMLDWLETEWNTRKDTDDKAANICVYIGPVMSAIHAIHDVGHDDEGRWWKFKGINNPAVDPYKVRDKNIHYLAVSNKGFLF